MPYIGQQSSDRIRSRRIPIDRRIEGLEGLEDGFRLEASRVFRPYCVGS
jgi:hypothetical protein